MRAYPLLVHLQLNLCAAVEFLQGHIQLDTQIAAAQSSSQSRGAEEHGSFGVPHLLLLMREGDSEEPKPNCLKKSNGSCRSCRAFASKPASPCISYFRRFSSSESTCRRVYRARACGRAGRSPNLIRIGYRRKLLCGACVAVLVRMILQRHLAIRLLQLRRIRIPGHAKFLQASVGALHNSARETQTS